METVTTIGLDIAKSVFPGARCWCWGEVVVRQKLVRTRMLAFFGKPQPCLLGIEAFGS